MEKISVFLTSHLIRIRATLENSSCASPGLPAYYQIFLKNPHTICSLDKYCQGQLSALYCMIHHIV